MHISKEMLLSKYGIELKPGKYRVYAKGDVYSIFTVKDDTEGCILLGMQATDHSLIGGSSRPAVALVKGEVERAIARGELVTIEIKNPC